MKRFKNLLSKLGQVLSKREQKYSYLILFLSLITGLSQSVSVLLVLPFVNVVFNPESIQSTPLLKTFYDLLGFDRTLSFLILLGALIFAAVIISNALMVLTIYAKTRFVVMRNHNISKKLLAKYLLAPYSFYLDRNSSELSKNILDEINQFTDYFLMALFDVLIHSVMLLVIFITILVIDFTASMSAVVIFGGLYGVLMLYFHKRLKVAGNKRLEANKVRYKLTQEALTSIKMTKVLGNERYYLEEFEDSSYQFAKTNAYARVVSAFPRYIIEGVAFGGLMLFVVIQLSLGRNLESLVPIVGVLGLAGYRMLPSLQMVFQRYSTFMYFIPILNKLVDEFNEESEYESFDDETNLSPVKFESSINLKNIHFQYNPEEHFSLQNITLDIGKNQVVGFMGETGSGKSTLIDIIMGLLKPEKGFLSVDEINIDKSNTKGFQKLIGYVPQEIFLSDDTLLKNIAFGMDDSLIDLERVKKAAKIAAIDEFIENELPLGYDTMVGERGVRLSGGQRQRIGIARALYRDPEIIVFDEATSALDNKTEKEVLKAINNAAKNRTVIMIAHRLNTLKNCDVIFKLDHGTLIKKGTYKEMVEDL